MAASNTDDCFREFFGLKLVGLIGDVWPLRSQSENTTYKTLIFEDGRGITLSSNGSWWVASKEDVSKAVGTLRNILEKQKKDIEEVAKLAGIINEAR
jgi:hypothetical protein